MSYLTGYLAAGLLTIGAVLAPYTVAVQWPTPKSTPPPIIETLDCATDSECEEAEATLEPWTWGPLGCEYDCIDPEPGSDLDEWCRQ